MPVKARSKLPSTIIKELEEKVKSLESQLVSQRSYADGLSRDRDAFNKELESVHGALDQIPGCPSRTATIKDRWGSESQVNITIDARLFGWLATKGMKE